MSIKLSLCTLSGCQSNVSYFKVVTLMNFSALKNRTCESVFSTLQKSTANEKLGIKVDCVAVGLAFLTSRQKIFYLEPYVFSQTFFVQIQYVSIKFILLQSGHFNQNFFCEKRTWQSDFSTLQRSKVNQKLAFKVHCGSLLIL